MYFRIAKPITINKSKYDPLRLIIRKAMNDSKELEYSNDPQIAKCARWQWHNLDLMFKKLGSFPEMETK